MQSGDNQAICEEEEEDQEEDQVRDIKYSSDVEGQCRRTTQSNSGKWSPRTDRAVVTNTGRLAWLAAGSTVEAVVASESESRAKEGRENAALEVVRRVDVKPPRPGSQGFHVDLDWLRRKMEELGPGVSGMCPINRTL